MSVIGPLVDRPTIIIRQHLIVEIRADDAGLVELVKEVVDEEGRLPFAGVIHGRDIRQPEGIERQAIAEATRAAEHIALPCVAGIEGNFRAIFHDATRDGREGGTNDADRPFRVSLDFLTHWRP